MSGVKIRSLSLVGVVADYGVVDETCEAQISMAEKPCDSLAAYQRERDEVSCKYTSKSGWRGIVHRCPGAAEEVAPEL